MVKRHLFLTVVVAGILWSGVSAIAFSGQRVMPYDDNSWGSLSFLITLLFSFVFWLPSQLVKLISGGSNSADHQPYVALLAIAIASVLDYALRRIQIVDEGQECPMFAAGDHPAYEDGSSQVEPEPVR